MKVVIAGSREIRNFLEVEAAISNSGFEITEVISGGARGVDSLGEEIASKYNFKMTRFEPDWDTHGKMAGFMRNRDMAEYADAVIAIWDGKSKGTADMISIAIMQDIPYYIHYVGGNEVIVKPELPLHLPQKIDSFSGEFRWLSNFWPCKIISDGIEFPSVEHAYVAAKKQCPDFARKISKLPLAGNAKTEGRGITLRPDWDEVKYELMYKFLRQKFVANSPLGQLLDGTLGAELIEGNNWKDTYWGVCHGKGQNNLGKLLMQIREENRRFSI